MLLLLLFYSLSRPMSTAGGDPPRTIRAWLDIHPCINASRKVLTATGDARLVGSRGVAERSGSSNINDCRWQSHLNSHGLAFIRASCCGARHLPRLSKAFVICRPLPLAHLASSATGSARIAPPCRLLWVLSWRSKKVPRRRHTSCLIIASLLGRMCLNPPLH